MTTAIHVTRRQAPVSLASVGLAAALLLTGCSGGGSGDGGPGSGGSPTPGATGPTVDTGGSPSAKAGKLEGSWVTTTGGKAVALVITGKQAGLFSSGGTVCSGTAGEEAGMQMIHLKCPNGGTSRGTGMVDSVNSTSMKVTWEGGIGSETYLKAEGGKLPSGLPTANLGS